MPSPPPAPRRRNRSRIPIARQHLELLAELLEDLDVLLRHPAVTPTLLGAPTPPSTPAADYLIDAVGLHALQLRHILHDARLEAVSADR